MIKYREPEQSPTFVNEEDASYFSMVPTRVINDLNLSDRQFRLVARIISFIKIKGEFAGSNKWLAKKHGVSERVISKEMAQIVSMGYFHSEMRTWEHGTYRVLNIKGCSIDVLDPSRPDVLPNSNSNNSNLYVDSEKEPTSPPPVEGELKVDENHMSQGAATSAERVHPTEAELAQQDIDDHPKALSKCSKTVNGKKVNREELNQVIDYYDKYNMVRALHRGKDSHVQFDKKACRDLIVLLREHAIAGEFNLGGYQNMLYDLYSNDYHKDTKWRYITPEFSFRDTTINKYYDQAQEEES